MENINILMSGFLFSSAILMIFISIYSFIVKKTPISITFSLLCLCFTFYSVGYAMELYSRTLGWMIVWNHVQYIGLPFLPALWLILSLQYANKEKLPGSRTMALIFVIPVITLVLRFTDSFHHLYYAGVKLYTEGLFPALDIEKGPWYLINGMYMFACIFLSGWIYLQSYLKQTGFARNQHILMLVASLLPSMAYILNLFSILPNRIDLGPFMGTISGILFLIVLFRFQLLDLKPLARNKVFESTDDGIIVLDPKFNVIDFNPRAAEIIPALKPDAYSKSIRSILSDNEKALKIIMNSSEGRFKAVREDGTSHYSIRVSEIFARNRQVAGLTVTISDVTKYIEAMEKLDFLASRDELTGLYNRRQFFKCGSYELERAKRYKHALSFIILDLDFFKSINDEYGHQAGDFMLKAVSGICMESLRAVDILGRFGGEEFVIFLPETGLADAISVAERICRNIEAAEIQYKNEIIHITASIGVTGLDTITDQTIDSFLRKADKALYRAKAEGRNCVRSESWN